MKLEKSFRINIFILSVYYEVKFQDPLIFNENLATMYYDIPSLCKIILCQDMNAYIGSRTKDNTVGSHGINYSIKKEKKVLVY